MIISHSLNYDNILSDILTYSAQNIGIAILLNLSMLENPLIECMTRLLWLRALLSTGTPVNYFTKCVL